MVRIRTESQSVISAPPTAPVRVVIAEGDEVTLLGLLRLLDRPGFEVVGLVRSLDEHVDVAGLRPDVVLLDPLLHGGDAFAMCQDIRAGDDAPKCVVVAHTLSSRDRAFAREAGLAGYITDEAPVQCLLTAIADVAAQHADAMTCSLLCDCGCDEQGASRRRSLTPQERRTAQLLADGLTDVEIAREMGLSSKTVRNYVSHILAKLDVPRRSGVAAALSQPDTAAGTGEQPPQPTGRTVR